MDTTRLSITIPTKTAQRIERMAESEFRSISNQAATMLIQAVERYEAERIGKSIEAMKRGD